MGHCISIDNVNERERKLLQDIFKKDPNTLKDLLSKYNKSEELSLVLMDGIKKLTEIQQRVINLYYGLDGNDRHNSNEIALIIDRTSTRVSQIKSKVIRLLNYHLSNITKLIDQPTQYELMRSSISILNLPTLTRNSLMRGHVKYIQDLLRLSAYDLLAMRNFGKNSANILLHAMSELGFNEWVEKIDKYLDAAVHVKNNGNIYKLVTSWRPTSNVNQPEKSDNIIDGSIDMIYNCTPITVFDKEIEKKYLIESLPDNLKCISKCNIEQGYLESFDNEIRIRKVTSIDAGPEYFITGKSDGTISRAELEISIGKMLYEYLKFFISKPLITKTRYKYMLPNGRILECNIVDEFVGADIAEKWMYAEVEFNTIASAMVFELSDYMPNVKDVTDDKLYKMKNYWKRTRCLNDENEYINDKIINELSFIDLSEYFSNININDKEYVMNGDLIILANILNIPILVAKQKCDRTVVICQDIK
jgi:CYTH domain-containing protein